MSGKTRVLVTRATANLIGDQLGTEGVDYEVFDRIPAPRLCGNLEPSSRRMGKGEKLRNKKLRGW